MRAYVNGIGIEATGLQGWQHGRSVLAGRARYVEDAEKQQTPRPTLSVLPATELRRSSKTVRLAVQVAKEALDHAATPPPELATVFASSGGEMDILHHLCEGLALPEREISPTRFHNSVHNAAAGYWSIAIGSRSPSTSLSCYDDTFSAGLLEAISQLVAEDIPVLLIAYDLLAPAPLHAARPLHASFATALSLTPVRTEHSLARLDIGIEYDTASKLTEMANAGLERLRRGNPAARALPLLAALACNVPATVFLGYLSGSQLSVQVSPYR